MLFEHQIDILEGSCDTDDEYDAENSALLTRINCILQYIHIVNLNCNNISHYYCLYCISDKINTALRSNLIFKKKLLKGRVFHTKPESINLNQFCELDQQTDSCSNSNGQQYLGERMPVFSFI